MLQRDVTYFGFTKNLRLDNGEVELIVPTEFGPRIIHYGLSKGRNVLANISPAQQSKPTPYGDAWHIYGGHRLWYAPEQPDASYYPDNRPVTVESSERAVKLTQEVEAHSGIEKSITIELSLRGSHVSLRHRLHNRGAATLELAPWALTAMAASGRAIFPHVPFVPHPTALAPARPLVLWPFTRMNDERFKWGERFISLRQDPAATSPQKIGLYDPLGYMAYALDGLLFLKRHRPLQGVHADFGCNVQTFSNELFLEIETLGPLVTLAPGSYVEHEEHWFLYDGFVASEDDAELEQALATLLARSDTELSS